MKVQVPDGTLNPAVSLPIARPTEAEVRAADLEQDDITAHEQAQRREARIRQAAYKKYERRGSVPGHAEEDWIEAERDIDQETADERGKDK